MVPAVKVAEGESPPSWRELFAIPSATSRSRALVLACFIDRLAMGVYFFAQPLLIVFALGMAEHCCGSARRTRSPPCCAPLGADCPSFSASIAPYHPRSNGVTAIATCCCS